MKNKKFYLLQVFRKRLLYPDLKRAVLEQARSFSVHDVLIVDKASGTQLLQDPRNDGLHGVRPYQPRKAKRCA